MTDNSTQAAPPRGAHDGPPLSGASQPGRRAAAPCPSRYLDEHFEVIYHCGMSAGHAALLHSSSSPQVATARTRSLLRFDAVWRDQDALR